MNGSDKLSFIEYYIPQYRAYAQDDLLYGAYGPRMYNMRGSTNQLENILSILRDKRSSRQAVVQLFNAEDISSDCKDVPCTCSFQFLLRNEKLEMITNMRSNDAYIGLPHDVFCFTMIQEFLARKLCVNLGTYKHFVGSLHLYEQNVDEAQNYLREGWQSTTEHMPVMPTRDPDAQLGSFLKAEEKVRLGESIDFDYLDLDKYWADLVRLLQIFRYTRKYKNEKKVRRLSEVIDKSYTPYITNKRLNAARVAEQK